MALPKMTEGEFEKKGGEKEKGQAEFLEVSGGELASKKEEYEEIITRNREQVEHSNNMVESDKERIIDPERKTWEQFDKEKPQSPTSAQQNDDDDDEQQVQQHAQEVSRLSSPEDQIEKIVQLAITKDPYYAIKVAKHLDDNYILNEVHDRLVQDSVRDEMLKRGLLKEI